MAKFSSVLLFSKPLVFGFELFSQHFLLYCFIEAHNTPISLAYGHC